MIETGLVIDWRGDALHWHAPADRTSVALPDSHDLWEFLIENVAIVSGFAHTHPGSGVPGPSHTDLTTFAAVEAGLGTRLDWWILSSDSMILVRWEGPGRLDYRDVEVSQVPHWADEIRRRSGIAAWEPTRLKAVRLAAMKASAVSISEKDERGDQT